MGLLFLLLFTYREDIVGKAKRARPLEMATKAREIIIVPFYI